VTHWCVGGSDKAGICSHVFQAPGGRYPARETCFSGEQTSLGEARLLAEVGLVAMLHGAACAVYCCLRLWQSVTAGAACAALHRVCHTAHHCPHFQQQYSMPSVCNPWLACFCWWSLVTCSRMGGSCTLWCNAQLFPGFPKEKTGFWPLMACACVSAFGTAVILLLHCCSTAFVLLWYCPCTAVVLHRHCLGTFCVLL
jgi:hypothetical protein